MSKTAEEILFIRKQAITALELSKGFTPEQRAEFSNSLKTVELFAGYILELTNTSAAQEVDEYKERLRSIISFIDKETNSIGCMSMSSRAILDDVKNQLIDTVK